MQSTNELSDLILFDAGVLIGALLSGDPRHGEAYPIVNAARRGEIQGCTTPGILSEVYGALTWEKAQPRHEPEEAAEAVRRLVELPSAIQILEVGPGAAMLALELAAVHKLRARRVHDARHAATALMAGVSLVYTYDAADWKVFNTDGLKIAGPESTLTQETGPESA
jgi:predicted nucleic acid-binding protein